MMANNIGKKVYAAMSGGVDSSVAAALLKEQGFNVVGVFFMAWSPDKGRSYCNWKKDRLDAMRVASKLGIPFKTWDFTKEYGKEVVNYMIDSYEKGRTPNPDIVCNKSIKFGLFLNRALKEGADYIATGHYARNKRGRGGFKVLRGVDKAKDQSYFLWTLKQEQLKYVLFPLGGYTKRQVREMAKSKGLTIYDKKDSQGVCFVGKLEMKEFLLRHIKPKRGRIVLLENNETIGEHDGIYYYTIGQRHGLDIKIGGGPFYVAGKNVSRNILYVAKSKSAMESTESAIKYLNWIYAKPALPIECGAQIRYRQKPVPAILENSGRDGKIIAKFKKPAYAVAPGQSAVFYKGSEMLGGGIIV